MCYLRAWHIPCCLHLSYCTDCLETFHFSWMSQNVTPDICTKKAISTNQLAQVEEINGILLKRKCNLISTASVSCTALIALHVALLRLPLWESRPFFFLATEPLKSQPQSDWQYLSCSEEGLNTNIQGNFYFWK